MNSPQIQPGARCECRDVHGDPATSHALYQSGRICHNDAVRTVPRLAGKTLDGTPFFDHPAYCELCAAWHESKAGVR